MTSSEASHHIQSNTCNVHLQQAEGDARKSSHHHVLVQKRPPRHRTPSDSGFPYRKQTPTRQI